MYSCVYTGLVCTRERKTIHLEFMYYICMRALVLGLGGWLVGATQHKHSKYHIVCDETWGHTIIVKWLTTICNREKNTRIWYDKCVHHKYPELDSISALSIVYYYYISAEFHFAIYTLYPVWVQRTIRNRRVKTPFLYKFRHESKASERMWNLFQWQSIELVWWNKEERHCT